MNHKDNLKLGQEGKLPESIKKLLKKRSGMSESDTTSIILIVIGIVAIAAILVI